MWNYLTNSVAGEALTSEPALFGILVVVAFSTLLGAALMLWSRRYRRSNPLASKYLNRLGNLLLWTGVVGLIIAGFFSQNALFTRRFWLYLSLLAVYAAVAYAAYFYFTRYPELERIQALEREKRRKYVPAPHTLAKSTATSGRQGRRRRKR